MGGGGLKGGWSLPLCTQVSAREGLLYALSTDLDAYCIAGGGREKSKLTMAFRCLPRYTYLHEGGDKLHARIKKKH